LEKIHHHSFSRVHYLKVLKRFRDAIANGLSLRAIDNTTPGEKYTICTWGMCSEDPKMWPEPSEHIWPYSFSKEGRVAPLDNDEYPCPLDRRKREQSDGNGCFYTCRRFKPRPKDPPLTREFALQLYDKRIIEVKNLKKGFR
jgi:hypothetical protein